MVFREFYPTSQPEPGTPHFTRVLPIFYQQFNLIGVQQADLIYPCETNLGFTIGFPRHLHTAIKILSWRGSVVVVVVCRSHGKFMCFVTLQFFTGHATQRTATAQRGRVPRARARVESSLSLSLCIHVYTVVYGCCT